MKKIILLCSLLSVCLLLCACAAPAVPTATETPAPSALETDGSGDTLPAPVLTVMPLPSAVDMGAVENCTLAVSFSLGDAYVDDSGQMRMKLTVYDYELFDLVEISQLKPGDIIVMNGQNVVIDSLERDESGRVLINGGLDVGGRELSTDENGVFYETGYNDAKNYYPVGTLDLPVAADFVFTDGFDLDNGPVEYYPGDFLDPSVEMMPHFVPSNTKVIIVDRLITAINRVYIP